MSRPVLILFHSKTSVASQKVRLVLAEKGLSYRSTFLDLAKGAQFAPGYRKLNPNSTVPTLVADGAVFLESNQINLFLEDRVAAPRLLPDEPAALRACQNWMQQSITLHEAINTLTVLALKVENLKVLPPTERAAKYADIPFADRRRKLQSLVEQGLAAPAFQQANLIIAKAIKEITASLETQNYLAGNAVTLADFSVLPFLHRLIILKRAESFQDIPSISSWLDRMTSRPSFARAIGQFHPPDILRTYAQAGTELGERIKTQTAQ